MGSRLSRAPLPLKMRTTAVIAMISVPAAHERPSAPRMTISGRARETVRTWRFSELERAISELVARIHGWPWPEGMVSRVVSPPGS